MRYLRFKKETKLYLILLAALLSLLIIEIFFTKIEGRVDHNKMREAVSLTENWFNDIAKMKKERNISSDAKTGIRYSSLIGDEFTDITTTLGSLEAKEISTNPEFAALMVKYLSDAGIDSSQSIGIILSGSFPALAISTFAAVQTLKLNAIIISSIGASMFGANQLGATWIEMEKYLILNGNLKYKSSIITTGAEDDNGGGLSEEGLELMENTAEHLSIKLYMPASLEESIQKKLNFFLENNVRLIVNIGGNQTVLGGCVHSSNIPNGFQKTYKSCRHSNRGIIAWVSEKNIPFINLLNIKKLAIENDISINPSVVPSGSIYMARKTEKFPALLFIICISGSIFFIKRNNNS